MYDGEGNHKVMTMEEVGFLSFFSFLFGYICSISRGFSADKPSCSPTLSAPAILNRERYVFTEFMDIKEKRARGLKV